MATADELIEDGAARVDDYANQAASFISALEAQVAQNIRVPIPGGKTFSFGSSSGSLINEVQTGRPVLPDLTFQSPTDPGTGPGAPNVREAQQFAIPTFAEAPPEIDIPERPTITLPTEPSAPSIETVSVPDAPSVVLPTVPTLTTIDFPNAPSLEIPVFTETFPVQPDLLLSQNSFTYNEVDYQNDVLDAVEAVLLSDINDGGFGITPADEEALYDRMKDREVKAALQRENETFDSFAALGHVLPVGTILALIESNKQETIDKISEANREVSVNRAELLRRGREFAISQGLSLNELLMRDYGFKQERALQAQRFAAEFAIQVFDAEARRYNAYIQAYSAFSQAYGEQVRAVLSRVEIFKAEVDAAIAKQQSNQIQIDIYKAQVDAANSLVNVFESQVRAAVLETEIEKTKLQQYQTQIQAFLGIVEARQSQVELYNSAIRGELAKSEIYKSQVDAYDSQVRSIATRAAIDERNVRTDIDVAQLNLAQYAAQVDKYKADLETELGRLNTLASTAGVENDIFRSVIEALGKAANADDTAKEIWQRLVIEDTKLDQEAARIALTGLLEEYSVKVSAAGTGAEVFTSIVSAGQSVLNALATVEE